MINRKFRTSITTVICLISFFIFPEKIIYSQRIYTNIDTHVDTTLICSAAYWTPEQAKEELKKIASTYHDKAGWEVRANKIRQTILHGAQLDPLPSKTPLNPIIRDKKVMDGYTVENVAFESTPGFWVTGNLYRPLNVKGKVPGILCPHGHWKDRRFSAEMQYRCAAFAKMGAVVFAYDMLGYGESTQCQHDIPIVLKVQTWNSIRSVDFLLSLKDVDPKQIAVTGASGGGTQTFLLTAVDSRIAVSAPVVMVSSYYFGGICEGGMPIHRTRDGFQTDNVEIAALAAPRPLLIVSDGSDFTQHFPEIGYPYIKHIYEYYNAGDNVENAHFPDEKHDYGISKRTDVYHFFAKHLDLNISTIEDKDDKIDESFVKILPREQLCVFNEQHPRPSDSVVGNDAVIKLFMGI